MCKNYVFLTIGRDAGLNDGIGHDVGSPPSKSALKFARWLFGLALLLVLSAGPASAQTTLISPTGDGGFANGSTFAANGWTVANSANNPWVVGTAIATAPYSGNSAYISNDGGVSNTYTPANDATNYFYRDVTVPAGETIINLSFNWRSVGEGTWDLWQVFYAPTSVTPVGVTSHPGTGTSNVPPGISGATLIGFGQSQSSIQTATFSLPASLAGTTFRLIFSWKNETGGTQPPASIDNISLVSRGPLTITSNGAGGLWSAPATWVGGIVPTLVDSAVIADGSTVTIDQSGQGVNNLTIGGGASGILAYGTTPSTFTIAGDLTVNAGGTFNVFNGATGKSVSVAGNITNNGVINLSVGSTATALTLNGTAVQTVGGSGSFTSNTLRGLTFNNTNAAVPNINWNFNNISIANTLTFTAGKVALGTNKLTLGISTTTNGTLTYTAGGFTSGTFNRYWTAAGTGTSITAGADPTTATSRYPFVSALNQNRSAWIERGAALAAGQLSCTYVDGTGRTPVSVADGAYTIESRYNGSWTFSTEGSGYAATNNEVALVAPGGYVALSANSRILLASGSAGGTHQNGTNTPGGQRVLSVAELTAGPLYIGAANADISQPCTGTPTPGSVSPATTTICAGTAGTVLTVSGFTTGVTGIAFQWEESDDNGVGDAWANAVGGSGATTASYTPPALSATRYYRVRVTCSDSALSAVTASVVINTVACTFNTSYTTGVPYTSIMPANGGSGSAFPGWQSASSGDDNVSTTVSLAGTTFTYQGQPVSGFQACSNGWMTFNTSNINYSYTNNLTVGTSTENATFSSSAQNRVLAPFWDDLVFTGQSYANRDSCLRYQVSGTLGSGSAVITVEWAGLERFNIPGPNLNFQVKLYESDNHIEFIYGSFEAFDGTFDNAYSYSVGYNGSNPAGGTSIDRFGLQTANANHFGTAAANLIIAPVCNSRITLTPGTYTGLTSAPTATAPANDNSGAPTVLTVNPAPVTAYCGTYYNSRNATLSPEPTVCGTNADDDVWFSFNTTAAVDYTIRLRCSPGYNGVLQLLDSSLASVACVNATGAGGIETINATGLVSGGATYYVRVFHNAAGSGTTGEFSLAVNEVIAPPTNDNIGTATVLTPNATCVATNSQLPNTLAATASPQTACGGTADDDVWYSFTATSSANVVTVTSGAGYNAHLQVYSSSDNTATGSLTSLTCTNNTSTGGLETFSGPFTAGNTYFIRVYHTGTGPATGNFSICVTAPVPGCATNFVPLDAATNIDRNATLTWTASTNAASYDIYFGTTPSPSFVANVTTTTYAPPLMNANTTYYWKVVPRNPNGEASGCVVSSFTTGTNIAYCLPVTAYGCADGDVIARVVLNTLDNNSGTSCPSDPDPNDDSTVAGAQGPGYSDYTSNPLLTTTLQAGSSYSCTVYAGEWTEGYAAWIDYNDDGVFDTSERIGFSNGQVSGSGVTGVLGSSASFPINVACNPPVGNHRLRVRAMYNVNGNLVTPCGNNNYGEVEDYIVTITEAVACPQPFNLGANTVTASTANLTWTTGCAETGWEVVVQPINSGVPTGPGVAVTSTTYPATFGAGGQEFYVRANCDGDGYSEWSGPFVFTAPGCTTPVSPVDDAIDVALNAGSVNLSWNAAPGATQYDVFFGTTAGSLTNLGTVAGTNVNIINMDPLTQYFWRIVPKNTFGTSTGCAEWSFTTAPDYCTPGYSTGKTDGDLISNIVITGTTLSNNSGTAAVNPAYTFFTGAANLTASLQAGGSYTVNVTVGSFSNQNVAAWVDYDDNFVFDPSERIGYTIASINANGTAQFQIVLDCNAPLGDHRMRVRDVYGTDGVDIDPCDTYGYGETEDYIITIIPASSCPSPSALTALQTGAGAVSLGWNSGCAETTWDVQVQSAGAGAPTGTPSNENVTTKPLLVSGLDADFAYEFWVRADCGLNGESSWVGPFAFTLSSTIADLTAIVGDGTLESTGEDLTLTGIVSLAGLTDVEPNVSGETPDIEYWIGVNSANTNPSTWGPSSWTLADHDPAVQDTFEQYSITYAATTVGTRYFATRARIGGSSGTYSYGGTDGTNGGNWDGVTYRNGSITVLAPDNDDFDDAIALSCGDIVTGTTVLATNDEPNPAVFTVTNDPSPNVWYSYTGTGTAEDITLSLCNSGFDTALLVATGTSGNLTYIAGNDDSCGTRSEVTFTSDGTTTYWIMVRGYDDTTLGVFELEITCAAACVLPSNDECAAAEVMTLGTSLNGTNACASASAVAYPTCGSSFSTYYDTWYAFNSGNKTSLPLTSDFTAPVSIGYAVYSGTCGGTLTQIACSTTGGDLTLSGLTTNTVYYIRVFSTSPTARGEFSIQVGLTPCSVTTTWNGLAWSNGTPVADQKVAFTGNYTASSDLTACELTVSNDAQVLVGTIDPVTKAITSAYDFDITGPVTVTSGSLTFERGSNLLQTGYTGANSGNITVKAAVRVWRQDYVYWGTPVTGQKLNAFSPLTLWNRFYTFNPAGNAYAPVFANATDPALATYEFIPGTGYMVRAPNTFVNPNYSAPETQPWFTSQFTGVPNNGTVNVTTTNGVSNVHMISNPYPSTINADATSGFLSVNPGTLYFWTHRDQTPGGNNYAMYNSMGGTAAYVGGAVPNGTIQVGQGFLFTNSNSLSGVSFTNAMRVGNNEGQFFRTSAGNRSRIWLNVANGSVLGNQMLVGYTDEATMGFDASLDGILIPNGNNISTLIGNDRYGIQARPAFNVDDIVPMGLHAETAGTFTVSLDHVDGIFEGDQDIFLKDNLTGVVTNLKQAAYSFATEAGDFNDRLQLQYVNTTLGIPGFDANTVVIYKDDNQVLNINAGTIEMKEVRIFDIRGRLVYTKEAISSNVTQLGDLKAEQQVLLVQITSADGRVVTKKVAY